MYFASLARVVLSILMGGFVLGQISALSPDYDKAKVAAARLFKLFDRKTLIDSSSEDGLIPVSTSQLIRVQCECTGGSKEGAVPCILANECCQCSVHGMTRLCV